MVVYSVAPSTGADTTYTIRYQDYLKPVKSPRESDPGDLSLKVLATQTGGKILGPNNDWQARLTNALRMRMIFTGFLLIRRLRNTLMSITI